MNDNFPIYYFPIYYCASCNKEIGGRDRKYNDGMCPHCGVQSDSTICDCDVKKAHWVTVPFDNNWRGILKRLTHNRKKLIEEIE